MTTRTSLRGAKSAGRQKKRPAAAGRRQQETASPAEFPKKALRAFLVTLAIGAGLILLASLGAYFMPDPDPMIRPLAYAAAALTALLGGFAAGKLHGSAPAVCGLVNGLLLLALMLLLSLFFRSHASGYPAWASALLHAAVLALSFAGALLGVRRRR